MLQLDDYTLPRHQQTISLVNNFADESLGGETSGTETAHKGIKPKELNVSFVLPFDDADKLGPFYQVAEATTGDGDLVVYSITERTANAVNIRQVKFAGRMECREMQDHHGWRISFKLREYLSTAEKTEQRQNKTITDELASSLAGVVANVDTTLA